MDFLGLRSLGSHVNWHTRHVCRQVNFCDGGVRFMHAHPQFGNILCGALLPSVMRRESQLGPACGERLYLRGEQCIAPVSSLGLRC